MKNHRTVKLDKTNVNKCKFFSNTFFNIIVFHIISKRLILSTNIERSQTLAAYQQCYLANFLHQSYIEFSHG